MCTKGWSLNKRKDVFRGNEVKEEICLNLESFERINSVYRFQSLRERKKGEKNGFRMSE